MKKKFSELELGQSFVYMKTRLKKIAHGWATFEKKCFTCSTIPFKFYGDEIVEI